MVVVVLEALNCKQDFQPKQESEEEVEEDPWVDQRQVLLTQDSFLVFDLKEALAELIQEEQMEEASVVDQDEEKKKEMDLEMHDSWEMKEVEAAVVEEKELQEQPEEDLAFVSLVIQR